jgi:hypothetical protein
MRAIRQGKSPFALPAHADVTAAAKEIERLVGEWQKGMEAAADGKEPAKGTKRAASLLWPSEAEGGEEGPPPAPDFGDVVPPPPAPARDPLRVRFVAADGEYVVLDDDTTWRVAEAARPAAAQWDAGVEVAHLGGRLLREDGSGVRDRRVFGRTGSRIASVESKGAKITLDDGSIWNVPVEDRLETAFWEPSTPVVALAEALLNPERGSKAAARRIR